jgi:hypothetical protein
MNEGQSIEGRCVGGALLIKRKKGHEELVVKSLVKNKKTKTFLKQTIMKILDFKIAVMAVVAGIGMSACGGSKTVVGDRNGVSQQPTIGEVTDIPCLDYDTEEYYVGVFSLFGPSTQMGRLGTDAQRGARQQLIEKMAHDYDGFVEQSTNSVGNNKGNDISGAMKSAGLEVIKQEVGRLRASCGPTVSKYKDENGNITVYVAMRMYEKIRHNPLKNNFLPRRKSKMGNGIETSEVPYPASFYHRFQTTLDCKSRLNL